MIAECTIASGPFVATGGEDRAELLCDLELIDVVRRARDGDLAAQSELVRRYARRLAGFLRGILHDRLAVEDLSQTVWIKIVQRLPSLRDPATFESWLFTTARNAALDHMRRLQCRPVATVDEFVLFNLPAPDGDDCRTDLLDAVEAATRGWTEKNRRILRDLVIGTSYRDMAEREQLPVSALKLRVHRMRKMLRAELQSTLAEVRGARA